MSRPGTTTIRSETRPARSARTGTGPWFIAGITGTVDTLADPKISVKSLVDYATRFGSRTQHITAGSAIMYDEAEFYFRQGGSELYVARTTDATDAALTAALAGFLKDLGPGQVSAPGRTTATQRVILADHAVNNNRIALHDEVDSAVAATLLAAVPVAGMTAAQERVSAMFGPWVDVPGVTPGTTRHIPPSGLIAGVMARNDAAGVVTNQPAAGVLGEVTEADGVALITDTDRTTLNANGINVLRSVYGGVRIYGYRTLADPADPTESNYLLLSNARLYMKIQAVLDEVSERFVFRQIDAGRLTINEYGGALTGELLPFWQQGALYGASPEEAFRVDVGPNVNTDVTIANDELRANVALRMSPFAEEVILEIVKTRITEAV